MFVFGSGVLIGTQLNVANPTPINFGLVQKVSVDTSVSVKELYGQYAFPVAVGSGTRKVTCKASLARFSGQALGRLFYNQIRLRARRSPSSPRSTASPHRPFHNHRQAITHFVADQGVIYAQTDFRLSRSPRPRRPANTRSTLPPASTHSLPATRAPASSSPTPTRRVDDGSEPRDRQPAGRSDVDLHGDAVRDRPDARTRSSR